MFTEEIRDTIVKQGICNYGTNEYSVFICSGNIFPGTGDYEDDVKICEDRRMDCYCIWFEDFLQKGTLNASGGYYESLEEAVKVVEGSPEFRGWND